METVCFCTFLSGPQAKLMCTVPHDCSDLLSPPHTGLGFFKLIKDF